MIRQMFPLPSRTTASIIQSMNRAFQLYRLQQIDMQLDQTRGRIREIDTILKDDTEIREAEKQLAEATKALDGAKKELKKAEENTQTQRQIIQHTEDQLYGGKVRNPKELQDLQKESEALGRYLEVLEERQLEAMMTVDELDIAFQSSEKMVNDVRARQIENHAALNGERSKLNELGAKLTVERQMIALPISGEDISHYENLRKRRAGIALAKVSDRSCAACGTQLATSQFQAALSSTELTHCDSCGRILYVG